ncbi:MAG: serine hydrolase [Cyclobacteriaceae bacterium]
MPRQIYLILCLLIPSLSWSGELSDLAVTQEKVKSLSQEELAGQLIIAKYREKEEAIRLIKQHHIGGFLLPEGDPYELRAIISELRSASTLPLWIGIETIDGLNPALTQSLTLPEAHTLASISDETLIANMGYSVGQILAGIGANIHFTVYPLEDYKKGMLRSGISILSTENLYRSEIVDLKDRMNYPLAFRDYLGDESTEGQLIEEFKNSLDIIVINGGEEKIIEARDVIIDGLRKKELRKIAAKVLVYKGQVAPTKVGKASLEELIFDKNRAITLFDILQKSLVARNGTHSHLPLTNLADNYFASLSRDNEVGEIFRNGLERYTHIEHFELTQAPSEKLESSISQFDWILVDLTDQSAGSSWVAFINRLSKSQYVAAYIDDVDVLAKLSENVAIIWNYESVPLAYDLVTQAFFGALDVDGVLPVDISSALERETSDKLRGIKRLKYGFPELSGMNTSKLSAIDGVMQEAIKEGATPGAQIMVVKNSRVVYEKSFGYQTYDSLRPINKHTLYDIASVSKVAGTLQAIMFLVERKAISLDDPIYKYFPELEGQAKGDMVIREILAHQAGLPAYYPFWRKTMDKQRDFSDEYYREQMIPEFDQPVVPGLYMRQGVTDSLWNWIISDDIRLADEPEYRYSDIGFMLLKRLADNILNQPMDDFLKQNIYDPIGIDRLAYNPLCIFDRFNIAPTEQDHYYRNSTIWGNVHDQNAAFVGGVAGHAGIFSNSNELAKLLQMHLNKGYYGGYEYFKQETVEEFIKPHFLGNRRGLGWDKPSDKVDNTSKYCSDATFGHTGFTGTAVWVDPEEELIYIFLSNRTYPDAGNGKLIQMNVRTKIQDIIYESIIRGNSSDD